MNKNRDIYYIFNFCFDIKSLTLIQNIELTNNLFS